MGKHSASKTVRINLPADDVLAALRDIGNESTWWPGMFKSDVLETDADGLVTKARIGNDVKIAKDEFDVAYVHGDSGYTWSLASKSSMQKTQEGSWAVKAAGASACDTTLALEIDASLPLPGFVLSKTIKDTVNNATKGLQKHLGG